MYRISKQIKVQSVLDEAGRGLKYRLLHSGTCRLWEKPASGCGKLFSEILAFPAEENIFASQFNYTVMQTWFEVKVRYVKVDQDGRERKVGESYLVDAVSFTDAETRIIQQMQQIIRGEFQVDNIKKSNIIEIFPAESGEFWYKAKIAIVTIDEKAGKEKKINNYFLVAADDFKEAYRRLEEGLSYILVPYQTTAMSLSAIADVFPYFQDETVKPLPSHFKPLHALPVEEDQEPVQDTKDDEEEPEMETGEAAFEPGA